MTKRQQGSGQRQRHQLVVSLGDGAQGAALKRAIEAEAVRQGLTVSMWGRTLLGEAVGQPDQRLARAGELEALERRLAVAEADLTQILQQLGLISFHR